MRDNRLAAYTYHFLFSIEYYGGRNHPWLARLYRYLYRCEMNRQAGLLAPVAMLKQLWSICGHAVMACAGDNSAAAAAAASGGGAAAAAASGGD